MKSRQFKSTPNKRYELLNAILDSGHIGSGEDWMQARGIELEKLEDWEIENIIWSIKKSEEKIR